MAITRLGGANAITGTIPQGNIANASLGAVTTLPSAIATGRVLQVLTATDSTTRNTTSTSFVTGSNTATVNITPSATSSKIFVTLSGHCSIPTQTGHSNRITVYRGSTNLGGSHGFVNFNSYVDGSTSGYVNGSWSISVLDSPSTSSQITYQMYFKSESGSYAATIGNSTKTTITVFEIGA